MKAIEVRDTSQVAEVRRAAAALAHSHGFGEEDAGRVSLVATELGTNVLKHGGGGTVLIGAYEDSTGSGIECIALDRGPGIPDLAASMRDGHSTAGSPGNGLGAIWRGSHAIDIYSSPGCGTAILSRLTEGRPSGSAPNVMPVHGAVGVALAGEEVCGDSWCKRDYADGVLLMVADGLGHGPFAAEAAHAASRSFWSSTVTLPSDMLVAMHAALRPTRGAAVAVARVDRTVGEITFAGVGNIGATIIDVNQDVRRMVSNNGTIGHVARSMRDFHYELPMEALIIMASDGLVTNWRLDAYPGLAQRHPSLIAAILYRDASRGRDDVTILVARVGPE